MTTGGPRDERGGGAPAAANTSGSAAQPRGASPAPATSRSDGGSGGGASGQSTGASALLPALSVPTGGGAIRGIGEKFSVNAATGTASLGVPLAVSPGRSGFGPQVELSYDSGGGNGPFGLGFRLSVPTISRKTDQGLPRYYDQEESDEYILSGAEDLVPTRTADGALLELTRTLGTATYRVRRYRPRTEGLFANIERYVRNAPGDPNDRDVHWRVTTRDNVTHVYGLTSASRIADPADARRVFSWLLDETRDDKGNIVRYEYKAEDGEGVDASNPSERSRFDYSFDPPRFTARAHRYLKRVHYCNRTPFTADFLMELVFDYGEHGAMPSPISEPGTLATALTPLDTGAEWSVRIDPFSTFRAGFELRTYRLCRRVLMFHKFAPTPLLVKSTDFTYEPGAAFTYLVGVTQAGYLNDATTGNTWRRDVMPTLRLDYRRPVLNDVLSVLPKESLEGLEGGVDGSRKQWVDLDGEGIPGVLIDSDYAWYYKSNRGNARLDAPRVLSSMPSPGTLMGGLQQLEDLAGDGQLDLVSYQSPLSGYFTRSVDGTFEALRNFRDLPSIDFRDPNLRFLDADGDGFPDILISEDHAFVWYRSKGKDGFDAAEIVAHPSDDAQGPAVVFSDPEQTIQLADMSGDGLVDIVRIRNGEVSYWPNLGYGRFGKKITLENSPIFDVPDQFDARRVRFGDVDGSGTSDLFYLGATQTVLYRNESGNRLAAAEPITSLPPVDNLTALSIADLFGTGTATLVWSSPLPGASSIFYVDLMAGKKPHLLEKVQNNLGAETLLTYAPSTKFYLADKAAGTPWLTRLAFPVHVIERIERFDRISKSRLVSTYRYAHGFFDGVEREFRGFARVEQLDAEEFTASTQTELFQAPVRTVTWFHTGAWLEKERLESALALEYFPPGPKSAADLALLRKDTHFEPDTLGVPLTIQDEREAARALRGSTLRQEIYAEDADITGDPDQAKRPYLVTEQNFAVRRLQSSSTGKHGVFLTFPRESLAIHTERNPDDPRIGHDFVLDVDPYGNVTRQASITYPRRTIPAAPPNLFKQGDRWATLSEALFANRPSPAALTDVPEENRWHRIGVEYEMRASELAGLPSLAPGAIYAFETIDSALETLLTNLNATNDLPFEDESLPAAFLRRRTLDRRQQLFYDKDTLTTTQSPLGLGVIDSLALPYETYQLALTTGHVAYLANQSSLLTGVATSPAALGAILTNEGAYVQRDANYWRASGRAIFDTTHFYLPIEAIDPFGNHSFLTHDEFSLLVVETRDALDNTMSALHEYRVLGPTQVTDSNLNRVALRFDALGMVERTALLGKGSEGDSLDNPTTRLVYDLLSFQRAQEPVFVRTFAREEHFSIEPGRRIQESVVYSDGFGRISLHKVQAEPGDVPGMTGAVDPRWVGTGRTVFNNKGKPVKQYEPFFSATSDFEDEADIVATGVTPITHYDPLDRVILTEFPDGTKSRVEFTAWNEATFDPNDTVLTSTWYSDRGSPSPSGSAPADPDQRAAWLAAQHADTPVVVHLDTLGRSFLSVSHNRTAGVDELLETRTALDIEGNTVSVTDARGIETVRQKFDVLARRLRIDSADAGSRLAVTDVDGKPLRAWDSRQQTYRYEYDALGRPFKTYVRQGSGSERLLLRTVYGEALDASPPSTALPGSVAQQLNLRGRPYHLYDCAGLAINVRFDFKGNPIEAARRLSAAYQTEPDWSPTDLASGTTPATILAEVESLLELETFEIVTAYDALNRVKSRRTPDDSVTFPTYNEANLLEQLRVAARGGPPRLVINDIDYNARGQRTLCQYADPELSTSTTAVVTTLVEYTYDPKTFRLTRLHTTKGSIHLQDLRYTYDPVGSIVELRDRADFEPFFNSEPVGGDAKYVYDAIYQLVSATGREHPGQNGVSSTQRGPFEDPASAVPHPNDTTALLRYLEEYTYDRVGNIQRMAHSTFVGEGGAPGPSWTQWTRRYRYETTNNRLTGTSIPGDPEGTFSEQYRYTDNDSGAHGSLTFMPHLTELRWDYADRLKRVDKLGGGVVFFTYDGAGQRVRKVWEHNSIVEERIYLSGFEIYRSHSGGAISGPVVLERETLHVMDDRRRVAMVETKTVDTSPSATGIGVIRWRFQLDNHLGSAVLELDQAGEVISYEEYHPYGSTAFHAADGAVEVSAKRYRYTGKERDEETGLYYHGARYYAPWLGRWTSADPMPGPNAYAYVSGRPITLHDPNGAEEEMGFWEFQGEYWKGIGAGAVELGKGLGHAVAHPIQTAKAIGQATSDAYEQDGVIGAVNVFNPLYHAGVAGVEYYEAAKRGDPREAGKQAFTALFNVATIVVPVAGRGAGLGASAARTSARVGTTTAARTEAVVATGTRSGALAVRAETTAAVAEVSETAAARAPAAAGVHPGRAAAESADITKESIVRQLRKQGSPEARATDKLIKRGEIDVQVKAAPPRGVNPNALGMQPYGTKVAEIYKSTHTRGAKEAAGTTVHEGEHVLQKLTPGTYHQGHEVAAFSKQVKADPAFLQYLKTTYGKGAEISDQAAIEAHVAKHYTHVRKAPK